MKTTLSQLMSQIGPKIKGPTKLGGYVESPLIKKCGTCSFISGDRAHCNEPTIMKDPQMKADPKTGLKFVNAMIGFCPMWKADKGG